MAIDQALEIKTVGAPAVRYEHRVHIDERHRAMLRDLDAVVRDAPEIAMVRADYQALVSGDVLEFIQRVVHALNNGESVTLLTTTSSDAELTSQEAADVLNVSRPHLVKLARQGAIPYRKVGNRHRFKLSDIRAYEVRAQRERDDALRALAPQDGYTPDDF